MSYTKEDLELHIDWLCSDETDHVQVKALLKSIMQNARDLNIGDLDDLFIEVEE